MKEFQSLFSEFEGLQLSPEDLNKAIPLIKTQTFAQGEIILQEGIVCKHLHFIQEGVIQNSLIEGQKKRAIWVFFAGEFCTALYSFYSRTPSEARIEALTDCSLLSLHYDDVQSLYDASKNWERIGRVFAERSVINVLRHKMDIQFKDARQRYEELIAKRPQLLQLLSLGQIANVLGISQETLSRIRAKR
ncbi:MAG: Crp/Fnr family transcriptional regulator [Bacteroidota bacterium]